MKMAIPMMVAPSAGAWIEIPYLENDFIKSIRRSLRGSVD